MHVKISIVDGATVSIRDVTINTSANNYYDDWSELNCDGDATIILEGTNFVKGSGEYSPGINAQEGKILTIKGDGSLTASTSGGGSGIGSGHYGTCGRITITDTISKVTATKGKEATNSIGAELFWCGTITIGGKITESISTSPYVYDTDTRTSGSFPVHIDVAGAYNTNTVAFYGRKSLGRNSDGTYKLCGWETLRKKEGSWATHIPNQDFTVSNEYVELGFEFDIALGTDWPYSGVFWKSTDTAREKINSVLINFGGTNRITTLTIKVNGNKVFHDGNWDKHSRYSWYFAILSKNIPLVFGRGEFCCLYTEFQ